MFVSSKKPSTPMRNEMNMLPRQQLIQSPMSKFSSMSPDKPLMPQSRSIRKQQIVDVNLSHIPVNRLYSPNPSMNSPPRHSLKQLTEKNNRVQMLKSPTNHLGPISRQTISSRPPTSSIALESSDPCLVLGFESVQGQSVKLKGLIRERQREIADLMNRLNVANLQLEKAGMQSKANVYYCELVNQIGDMLGMESISLNDLKKRIKELVDRNQKDSTRQNQSNNLRMQSQRAILNYQKQLQIADKSKNELMFKIQEITQRYHKLQLSKKQQQVETTKIANQNYLFQKRVSQLTVERDNLITQINNSKNQNNTQALKNRLKQTENKLIHQGEQNQMKLQQLMNLRVIKQRLQSELSAKSKECLKFKSQLEQIKAQSNSKQKQLVNQIQQINQLKQIRQLQVEGINKITQKYQLQLGSVKRQLNIKINEYDSLMKTYQQNLISLENIKQEMNKELGKQHELRIAAEEKFRSKQMEISKYQTHITSLEKQNLGFINEVRQLEVGNKGQLNSNKQLQRNIDNLENQLHKQRQILNQIKKSFEIEKNEWIRQHNIKIKLQIEPLKQRTMELQVLCRKYQGIIRQLEQNSKHPSTLKDARNVVNQLHFIAKSQQYSQEKISQIEKLIKQIVTNQSISSQKMSLDLTKSIINIKQDEQRRFNQMLTVKDREINDCRGRIGELEAKFRSKVAEVENLNLKYNQQNQNKETTRKQLQLSQQEVIKYSQQIIKYKSKVEILEKSSVSNNNHQLLIQQYQRQISSLQLQLNQVKLSQNDLSLKQSINILELRLKQSQSKYQQNVKSLQTTYKSQLNNIKQSHKQGLTDLEQIYSKSRLDAMNQNELLRVEINRVVTERAGDNQRLEARIRMLEKQLQQKNRIFEQETQRFSSGESDRIIKQLKMKIEQYEMRISNSHTKQQQLRSIMRELQTQNEALKRQYNNTNFKNKEQQQFKLRSLQELSNRQLEQVIQKLQSMISKNQKLQNDINETRGQNDILRQKNVELNLQIVNKLSSDDINKQLLRQRNNTIIHLQQQLNQTTHKLDQLRNQTVCKSKTELQQLIVCKSIQFNAEKQIINLKNSNRIQQLKIQELSAEISTLQHVRNMQGVKHIQNYTNINIPSEPMILKRPPSSRNGNKPSSAEQRNPRISSLEKTIEATRTLIENNRRTSAQIKAHLPTINTIDPFATIKPVSHHQRSGSRSPRSSQRAVNLSRLVLQTESPRQMVQSPTLRSHLGERQRPPSRGEAMFKKVKDDKNLKKPMNFNYSRFYEENGIGGQNKLNLQFNGIQHKSEPELKSN